MDEKRSGLTFLRGNGSFDRPIRARVLLWAAEGWASRVLVKENWSEIRQTCALPRPHLNPDPEPDPAKGTAAGAVRPRADLGVLTPDARYEAARVVDLDLLGFAARSTSGTSAASAMAIGLLANPAEVVIWHYRKNQVLFPLPLQGHFTTLALVQKFVQQQGPYMPP